MRRAGFTLLELLTAVAIIAALAAISLPVYQRVSQGGKSVACLSNLRQIGSALNLYVGEHNAALPTMMAGRNERSEDVAVLDTVLLPYASNTALFLCPADGAKGPKSGTSYYWNSALNGQSVAALSFFFISESSRIPLLFDKDSFHPYETNKVNFLYADGHATKELKLTTSK